MKLLFVAANLGAGGAERVMSLLANQFEKKGYEVEFVFLKKDIRYYPLPQQITITLANNECESDSLVKKILWLRKYIKKHRSDVVFAFRISIYLVTLLSLIGIKVPVIASERIDPNYNSILEKILQRILLPLTDWFVVQTSAIKAYYPKFIQKKTDIIFNPVSEKVFEINDERLMVNGDGLAVKEKKIISVGRLHYQKNQKMMIEAFARVADDFPEWKLVIYGEGPERGALEKLIASLNDNDSYLNTKPTKDKNVGAEEQNTLKDEDESHLNTKVTEELMVNGDGLMVNGDRLMVNDKGLMVNDEGLMVNDDRLMVNGERLKISSRILLPGRSEKVIEEMNKSEIFAFSSDYEGMSNAVVEAFCVGLPIITTKVSGTEDFIRDGENGFLLDIGDTDGMEKTMRMLMSNEKLRRKMGEKNKMEAEQFKIEHIFQQWEDVVNKVVNH